MFSLAVASAAVQLLPFKRLVEGARAPRGSDGEAVDLSRLRGAVDATARRVPWRAVCFQRALALRAMLRRRGVASVLHYGIARADGEALKAHVWLSVAGDVVIGGEVSAQYARVGDFPERSRP